MITSFRKQRTVDHSLDRSIIHSFSQLFTLSLVVNQSFIQSIIHSFSQLFTRSVN